MSIWSLQSTLVLFFICQKCFLCSDLKNKKSHFPTTIVNTLQLGTNLLSHLEVLRHQFTEESVVGIECWLRIVLYFYKFVCLGLVLWYKCLKKDTLTFKPTHFIPVIIFPSPESQHLLSKQCVPKITIFQCIHSLVLSACHLTVLLAILCLTHSIKYTCWKFLRSKLCDIVLCF